MAAVGDEFESWLSHKLNKLNTDEGVFGSYIKGILDGDETIDEKTEALEGILIEITESDIPSHCQEIIDKWKSCQISNDVNKTKTFEIENVEEKLVRLMETNAPSTIVQKTYTEEERRIKEAILANYSQTSDVEIDDYESDDSGEGEECKDSGLVKNTNAALVQQAQKEKRERAKIESQKKKDKDREDREKQKKELQDKKEKRKTQKGERRR